MKTKVVPLAELIHSGKWGADLHLHTTKVMRSNQFKVARLGDVAVESKATKIPEAFSDQEFYYIGLENVEPMTGSPLDIPIVNKAQIRSRSKVFTQGDVLYGRLRPYLRKSLYVDPPYAHGLCSTEFIVLKAVPSSILPLFLRELLISDAVTERITRMQKGVALPRVSSKDLLNIQIPIPPLDYQEACIAKFEQLRKQRQALMLEANALTDVRRKHISKVFL